MPQDNAGNNLLTARNIGIPGSNNNIYQDHVGGADRDDYYRFLLTQTQNFRASLTGLSADADIEVLDWLGQRVRDQEGISQNTGTASESINLDGLGAGIYYIRIYQFSGDTDYTLGVRAENPSAAPPDLAGNNLSSARSIGFLGATNQIYRDWVGSADNNDYYQNKLPTKPRWVKR
jgi:Bacterial pre-peptidase C-terminal domain